VSGRDDWAPGDLALCVRGGHISGPPGGSMPQRGRIYPVERVSRESFWNADGTAEADIGLWSAEFPANDAGHHVWWHGRFRKIRPLTDEETAAFTADLRDCLRTPAKQDA
jgi:hypothetical protein